MKLNLLLIFGIATNIVTGANPTKTLPPKIPILTTVSSSLNASPTSTKVIIPRKKECPIPDIVTDEQKSCEERGGYYIQGSPIDEEGHCNYRYVCFLPSGAKKIFPDAYKAQSTSECISIDNRFYCAADLNNFNFADCTFPQFVQMVYEHFGEKFHYETLDETTLNTKSIELPTNTAEKIKCPKGVSYDHGGVECINRGGNFIKMSFYPDCDHDYYACFLSEGRKISKNAVVAQNLSECVTVYGERSCSIDYTNIPCPDGKECTFTALLQEISQIFGEYFTYEPSSTPSLSSSPVPTIVKEFCRIGNLIFYDEETNCADRNGKIIYGAPVDDEGQCDYQYACFLPSGSSRIFPDAYKAEDPSECIDINGDIYCSADLNNIDCPECTFPQFVTKVKEILEDHFDYDPVDISQMTKPIILPKDTPSKSVECVQRKNIPESPYNACLWLYGEFYNMEFYPDCEKTYYACFIPQGEDLEAGAIKAKDLSECITINDNDLIYCAVDYYDGFTCTEHRETCTFSEFVQEMANVYGDYFSYRPYLPKGITTIPTTITVIDSTTTDSDSTTTVIGSTTTNSDSTTTVIDSATNSDSTTTVIDSATNSDSTTTVIDSATNSDSTTTVIDSATNSDSTTTVIDSATDSTTEDIITTTFRTLSRSTKTLPPKKTITTTLSSIETTPTTPATKVIIPFKPQCPINAMETDEQRDCGERDGYFIHGAPMDEAGHCEYHFACFLPSGANKILPYAFKAQDSSECIEIKGRYYCSADLNNFTCTDCTFSQFVEKVYETFGEFFHYDTLDIANITDSIELPTQVPEKIKCATDGPYSDEEQECRSREGYFLKMSFYPDCDKEYYACFLPDGKKVTKNGVVAQNLSECINIYGRNYCSINNTNISCSEGKECTFTELLHEISYTFGDYFFYKESTITSTDPVTIPVKEFCEIGNYQYYSEESNCEDREGKIVYGAPLDDEGQCDYKYACFLPAGSSRIFPDAYKAEDPSECIEIYGKIYCTADLNNINCPDCTSFAQFVDKVKEVLDYKFDYDPVDISKWTEPIPLPKDIPPRNVECVKRKSLANFPYDECRREDGLFYNMEFHPDCEKSYYACLVPQGENTSEKGIKAQDPSECITIGKYRTPFCAADYYGGITCPEGKENCTFAEFIQEMSRIYGDYFQYKPYLSKDTTITTTITIPIPTTTTTTVDTTTTTTVDTTTTTEVMPEPTECIPITITEKVKEVVTVKETVTITVESYLH